MKKLPLDHTDQCMHNASHLTLSAPWAKSWSLVDGINQDQTAQNEQSDLDLCHPLVESDICSTIICGTLWILFIDVKTG